MAMQMNIVIIFIIYTKILFFFFKNKFLIIFFIFIIKHTYMDIFTVYKITCIPTNKLYIGYTKQPLKFRLQNHFSKAFNKNNNSNIKFQNAIRKYGKINFIIEAIQTFEIKEDALLFEIETIYLFNTINEGYNTTIGGLGGATKYGPLSDEHKNKISNSLQGRTFSDEHKENIKKNHHDVSGKKNPSFGKPTDGSFKSGCDHPKSIPVIIDGVKYESIRIAAKTLKIAPKTIKNKYL